MAQYIAATKAVVNSVDMTDHLVSCELVFTKEAQDITSMADNFRRFQGGLETCSVTMEVQLDQAAADVSATFEALVGTTTTIALNPTNAATSATNRLYTITNAFLESFAPISGSVGSIATATATFQGGDLTITSV
jgi:hypothetical protein